ncbi:MAG TPA: glycosyltransferase family 4 protein [Acidimicrobiales bacterium]|nr:glycosyltransferase family 4 protein [Acidimicrobiales bacterium]
MTTDDRLRIAIYDAHWTTLGGGEKLAGSFAEALQVAGDVTLLAHEDVDVPGLNGHLDVHLGGVRVVVIPNTPAAVTEASAAYDVFINCSFLAHYPAAARRSIFVTMFPDQPSIVPSGSQRRLLGARDRILKHATRWHYGEGFYPTEGADGVEWRWTNGDASLGVTPLFDGRVSLMITATGEHLPIDSDATFAIEINGVRHRRALDRGRPRTYVFPIEAVSGERMDVRLVSEVFEVSGDPRQFGMQVLTTEIGLASCSALSQDLLDLNHVQHSREWLMTYDHVVSISEFTKRWVHEYWDCDSVVVYPAVRPREAGGKQKVILSIGRFFDHLGHSKRQRELVDAFRILHERPEAAGWQLKLLGGSADPHYVTAVRSAAVGLPVSVIENADGDEVRDALASASIYWHGMGLHADPYVNPIMFEHFGISIVEAMSAGAVPLVVDGGGQAEIVEDGVSGLLYRSVPELVEQTALLLRDEPLFLAMRTAAQDRARAFGPGRFQREVLELAGISAPPVIDS